MCSPARCTRCGKASWTGCGRHVDDVMASVAPTQRCDCNPENEQPARQSFWARRRGLQ